MGWVEHKRSDARKNSGETFISLRRTGIAFSAAFVGKAGATAQTRTTVMVDADQRRVGFKFHSNERDRDAYALRNDGGAHSTGRWIQSQRLYKDYLWLGEVLTFPSEARHFEPEFDPKNGLWFITIPASSEVRRSSRRGRQG